MSSTVSQIYLDGTYASKNSHFGDNDASWKAGNVLRMIGECGIEPKSICEAGCGGGGILLGLKSRMPDDVAFTGYEPMPEAYRVASSRETDRLHFIHGSPAGLTPDSPFDLVLCLDVFEHVEDYIGFVRGLRGLGRRFFFHIPLDMNAQMVFRGEPIRRVRETVGHLHYFNKDTALATLEEAGLAVERWFYTDGSHSTYNTLKFRLAKLPRKLAYAINPDFTARVLGGYSLMVSAVPV